MANSNTSAAGELERIAALRDQGVLTDAEFAAQKSRILGTPSAQPLPKVAASPDGISDRWVYAILPLPLLAMVLLGVAFSHGSDFPIFRALSIPNLLLMLLDHGRLKAAGKEMPVWQLFLGFVFMPFYLFFRARRLGRGLNYFGWYIAEIVALLVVGPILISLLVH